MAAACHSLKEHEPAEQRCTNPACQRLTGWHVPGLCWQCHDEVCRLREQDELDEAESCDV
jgi:hypothetical protein